MLRELILFLLTKNCLPRNKLFLSGFLTVHMFYDSQEFFRTVYTPSQYMLTVKLFRVKVFYCLFCVTCSLASLKYSICTFRCWWRLIEFALKLYTLLKKLINLEVIYCEVINDGFFAVYVEWWYTATGVPDLFAFGFRIQIP
jgi:hypothetical protein